MNLEKNMCLPVKSSKKSVGMALHLNCSQILFLGDDLVHGKSTRDNQTKF